MRSKRALINTIFGVFNQLMLAILNVIIRRVMISTIGVEYLGVNGLFGNVLSLLALTESGFGVAITYKLYKPIADKDETRLSQLLGFYNKVYNVIAFVITIVGVIITPFLPFIINQTDIPMRSIYIYYILFLLNNVAGYFIAYKTVFLTACQKSYYAMIINTVVTLAMSVLKIICLLMFKSYILYMVITIFNTIIINVLVAVFVNKEYPFMKNIDRYKLPLDEKKLIFKDCKALMYHKIGAYVLTGTDNILISAFVNITMVGLYSNYLIVINLLNNILTKLFDAIVPAIGDKLAVEGDKPAYESFKMVSFFDFLIQFFCTGMLLCLLQPFIILLFGKECLLDTFTVLLLGINFFFLGMRRPAGTMKNASGVFFQDRYWALTEAIVNLIVSIIGVKSIGLPGIFVGTIVSGLFVPNIAGPFFLYRDVFHVKFKNYIFKNIEYYIIMLFVTIPVCNFIGKSPYSHNIYGFLWEVLRCLVIWGGLTIIIAFILPERKYILRYAKFFRMFIRRKVVKP